MLSAVCNSQFIEKKMAGKKDYVLAVEYMEDKQ